MAAVLLYATVWPTTARQGKGRSIGITTAPAWQLAQAPVA